MLLLNSMACSKKIDVLHETIVLYREREGHPFKDCELKNDHSKLGNKHETDPAFSRAVDKTQNKKENELTNQEKESCKGLLKKNHLNWAGIDNQDEDDDLSSKEELQTQDSATFSLKSIYSQASKKAEEEERKVEVSISIVPLLEPLLGLSSAYGVSLMHLLISAAME